MYGRTLIPPEVQFEVAVGDQNLRGSSGIGEAKWIEVVSPKSTPAPDLVRACHSLGAGERGAIYLARSLAADLILLDERKARRVASEAGAFVIGCVGMLEGAARRGLVPDLRQVYIDLLQHGIRFDIKLLQDSLARLGLTKL
jgi:uncharacterized protein